MSKVFVHFVSADVMTTPLSCHPFPDRRCSNWSRFYSEEFPSVLYRVQVPSTSHSIRLSGQGFLPSVTRTRRNLGEPLDDDDLHHAAVRHCHGWNSHHPSPFVSLTASFGYAVWEARRRYTWSQGLKDSEIWFVDGTALKQLRPPRVKLFHALELIDDMGEGCDALGCSRECEVAARFANAADEVLVLGGVPEAAIVGGCSFETISHHLPGYFFRAELRDSPPWRRKVEHLDDAFSRKLYRDAYAGMAQSANWSASSISPAAHADEAVSLAAFITGQPSILGRADRVQDIETIAKAVAHWLIAWSSCSQLVAWRFQGVGGLNLHQYINDYVSFVSVLAINVDDITYTEPLDRSSLGNSSLRTIDHSLLDIDFPIDVYSSPSFDGELELIPFDDSKGCRRNSTQDSSDFLELTRLLQQDSLPSTYSFTPQPMII